MLQSPAQLASLRLDTAAHFLRNLSDAPWSLIAGGVQKAFGASSMAPMAEWIGKAQVAQQSVYVALPAADRVVWHLAVQAPIEARTADMRLPPSLVVASNVLTLIWRLNDAVLTSVAKVLCEKLAKEIGGKSALGQAVPLPGTVAFHNVGPRLAQRIPVQMLPPLPKAYRIADGELAAPFSAVSGFVRADRVLARPIAWVWPGVIPAGEFSIIMGEPGIGKSQIAIDIAARVTTGAEWPTGGRAEKGSVIVMETEDDIETVVVPRLKAAGADVRKTVVHSEPIDLSQRLDVLIEEAKRIGDLRLIVLSPVRMFFGATESGRQVDTRSRMEPLLKWASATGVAVLGVAHKEAGKKGRSSEDMAGPKAFAQRARAVHTAARDDRDSQRDPKRRRRVLITAKANSSDDSMRLVYRIEGVKVGDVETSRVIWDSSAP